jgi:hypothetical protein
VAEPADGVLVSVEDSFVASTAGYVLHSSVPFIVVGPGESTKRGRLDGVLVRANNASVELVGFVREIEVVPTAQRGQRVFPLVGRRYLAVTSQSRPLEESGPDSRTSTYTFAWEGRASRTESIEDEFEKSLPHVLSGIDRGSVSEIEWSLGHLMFMIQRNETRIRQRNGVFLVVTIAYLITLILILVLASHR